MRRGEALKVEGVLFVRGTVHAPQPTDSFQADLLIQLSDRARAVRQGRRNPSRERNGRCMLRLDRRAS